MTKRILKTIMVFAVCIVTLYGSMIHTTNLHQANEFMIGISPIVMVVGAVFVVLQLLNQKTLSAPTTPPLPFVAASVGERGEGLVFMTDKVMMEITKGVKLGPLNYSLVLYGAKPNTTYTVNLYKARDSKRKGVRIDKCSILKVLEITTDEMGFYQNSEDFSFAFNPLEGPGRFFYFAEVPEIGAKSQSCSLSFYNKNK